MKGQKALKTLKRPPGIDDISLLLSSGPQPFKTDLDKKLDPKQKTFQTFNIDAQRFTQTKNENPLMREIGINS